MAVAHSDDLRRRVVAEVAAGSSRRQASARFRVSAASAIRWVELEKATGSVSPRRRGGESRAPLEAHAAWLKGLVAREGDLTLAEIVERAQAELGFATSQSAVRRFFLRHRISVKKNRARRRAGPA
jgi:transposase